MAMLIALNTLADNGLIKKETLFCLHVEHALRPAQESLGDAEFVRTFCQKMKIECHIEHIPPGKIESFARRKGTGIEAAARFFRHRALSRKARQLGKETLILLGHTKDDLLELVLMRILRGVGPAGLAAMPQRRGRIFRPLLALTRSDVIAYLKEKDISWREDNTNTDVVFLRNRIRQQLIPLLNESFPDWKKGITSMAETQSLVSDFLTEEASSRIRWNENFLPRTTPNNALQSSVVEKYKNGVAHSKTSALKKCGEPLGEPVRPNQHDKKKLELFTNEENFFKQPLILREEAVFQGINALSLQDKFREKSIKRTVVRKFCEGKVNAADLGSVRLRREKGKILLSRAEKEYFECGVSRLIIEPKLANL